MKFSRKTGTRGDSEAPAPSADSGEPEAQPVAIGKSAKSKQRKSSKRGYLDGQMLIAMPSMGDDRFARSVIYVCAHSTEGAMGIIVNQPAAHISFSDLLVQLDVIPAADLIQLPGAVEGVKDILGAVLPRASSTTASGQSSSPTSSGPERLPESTWQRESQG